MHKKNYSVFNVVLLTSSEVYFVCSIERFSTLPMAFTQNNIP